MSKSRNTLKNNIEPLTSAVLNIAIATAVVLLLLDAVRLHTSKRWGAIDPEDGV